MKKSRAGCLVSTTGCSTLIAGTGTAEQIRVDSWSPDGKTLALIEATRDNASDVVLFSLADRRKTPFAATRFNETAARFSPDSRWLAWVSDESGRQEIYVRAVSGASTKSRSRPAAGSCRCGI